MYKSVTFLLHAVEKNGNMNILCRKNSCCMQNILTLAGGKSYLSHSENIKASKESGKLPVESETHVLLIHFRALWIYFFCCSHKQQMKNSFYFCLCNVFPDCGTNLQVKQSPYYLALAVPLRTSYE